ncbi:hypothetical protein JCM3765_001451 [Sporobolomyces pararoseus]
MEVQTSRMQLRPSEMTRPPGSDQKLPALSYELVTAILEVAAQDSNFRLPLLSRSYLPAYLSILHRTLRINNQTTLNEFNKACERDPSFSKFVRFVVDGQISRDKDPLHWTRDRRSVDSEYDVESWQKMFSNFTNLRSLELGRSSSIVLLLRLNLPSILPSFQRLTYLDISLGVDWNRASDDGPVEDGQHSLFRLIESCPTLTALRLNIGPRPFLGSPRVFSRIKILTLEGKVFQSGGGGCIYDSFPNVETLHLHNRAVRRVDTFSMPAADTTDDPINGLELLPPSITSLSLRQQQDGSPQTFARRVYPHLNHLKLEIGIISFDFALSFTNLPSLQTIEIGPEARLGVRPLELISSVDTLVDHVANLSRLEINAQACKMGHQVAEGGSLPPNLDVLLIDPEWRIAGYTAAEEAALRAARQKWRSKGIEVTGSTSDSLEVVQQFREERKRRIEIYLASEQGQKERFNEDLVSIE